MLDQSPDNPHDDSEDKSQDKDNRDSSKNYWGTKKSSAGRGGMLGRFGAHIAPTAYEDYEPKPFWRVALVFLFKTVAIFSILFAIISTAAVFVFGWTGPPPTITMVSRSMNGIDVQREWAPLEEISPHLVRAVIAAEDQRFCSHNGFDVDEIRKAIEAAEQGRGLRGASTITQQTAKNVYLFNGGSFPRKGVEAWFTFLTEKMWSKPRIIETYLNVAEWGDGLFGAEAAAQARFGVSAQNLTAHQAALMAAVLPSPHRWKIDGNYTQRRAGQIMTLMSVVERDGLDRCLAQN